MTDKTTRNTDIPLASHSQPSAEETQHDPRIRNPAESTSRKPAYGGTAGTRIFRARPTELPESGIEALPSELDFAPETSAPPRRLAAYQGSDWT